MKCKHCKNEIEKGSYFCRYCGAQIIKSVKEISVPTPKQRADGSYYAQVMVDGKRILIDGLTEMEYRTNAISAKTGKLEIKKPEQPMTLHSVISDYINANDSVLSESTIRGYNIILRNRFKNYMQQDISKIDFQAMVNDEAKLLSEKSIKNSFALVKSACTYKKIQLPKINLPKVPQAETNWLNYKEIETFLKVAEGEPGELEALLALHSLRVSEILALTPESFYDGCIHVRGSIVLDTNNTLVYRELNKTDCSCRTIPVLIDRLNILLNNLFVYNGITDGITYVTEEKSIERKIPKEKYIKRKGKKERTEKRRYVSPYYPLTVYNRINKICDKANFPHVGCHGLRRSFVSLAFHLRWDVETTKRVGGWNNIQTVMKYYKKLSDMEVNDDIQNMRDYYKFTKND